MWNRIHRLPSPSMAIAFLALLAALGGTAIALPGKNGVKQDDVARGAIGTSDLARNAVTNGKVRNRNLTGPKFRRDALGGNAVKESTLGKVPTAATADTAGTANTANTANRLGRLTVQRVDFTVLDSTANGATASCPAGQQAISGGVRTNANDSYITKSRPVIGDAGELNNGDAFNGWRGYVFNQPGASGTITSNVYVVCVG